MEIKFVIPSTEYLIELKNFRNEFIEENVYIHGSRNLAQYDDINEWLKMINDLENIDIYLAIYNEKIVGIVSINFNLNDSLIRIFGPISYSVAKSFRNKGIAKKLLKYAIVKCIQKNIDNIFISCNEDNLASKKVILSCDGCLKSKINYNEKIYEIYNIKF